MIKKNIIWAISLIAIIGLMFVINKEKPMGGVPLTERQMIIEKGKDLWVIGYIKEGKETREFITEEEYNAYKENGLPDGNETDQVVMYKTAEFTEKEPVLKDYEYFITDKATTTGKVKVKLPDKEAKEVDIALIKDKQLTSELLDVIK